MSVDLTGQRLGHYLVQEVIGRGGMSVVYRAVDERLQRSVALKVMSENLSADPEFRARFIEEARAASAIDHVNVVPLYDFGEVGNLLFIAMRLVDGTDLARELVRGQMPIRRVMSLLGQVGAALDLLHERGLVHLDVKPANVLITRNESVGSEHVYLADFGLTRRDPIGHRTTAGDFLGSPTYASPEHLRGQEVVPGSDEYSLTCMLFTALAGRPPFTGDVRAVITGHLSGVVPSLSALTGLPPAIDRVIARGMATDPESRYASSSDLLGAARRAISADEPRAVGPAVGADPSPGSASVSGAGAGSSAIGAWSSAHAPQAGPPVRPVVARPGPGRPAEHTPGPSPTPPGPSPTWTQISAAVGGPPLGPGTDQRAYGGALGQAHPIQFDPERTARRSAGQGIGAAKPKWPWITGGVALVAAVVAVVVLLLSRNSGGGPVAPGTDQSGVSSPTPSTSVSPTSSPTSTTNTLLQPSVLPTNLPTVSGLPNPFTTSTHRSG